MISQAAAEQMLNALHSVSGLLRGLLGDAPTVLPEVLAIVTEVEAAIGAGACSTPHHDAGAFARCSFCGRYSADPRSIAGTRPFACDCGETCAWWVAWAARDQGTAEADH